MKLWLHFYIHVLCGQLPWMISPSSNSLSGLRYVCPKQSCMSEELQSWGCPKNWCVQPGIMRKHQSMKLCKSSILSFLPPYPGQGKWSCFDYPRILLLAKEILMQEKLSQCRCWPESLGYCANSCVPLALDYFDACIPDNHCVRTVHIPATAHMSKLHLIQKP